MQIEKDVYVPMRDGVSLAVDLYQPDELREHAAVLLVTPYLKDGQMRIGLGSDGRPVAMVLPPSPPGVNLMLLGVKPLVDQGYVVVVSDARGTGYSEGVYDYYNLEGGPFDGYDTVEWIAAQPWCDGNVGLIGASAGAIQCYTTAVTRPPHLRAMVPNMHPADFYFDMWHIGGVFRYENRINWSTGMIDRIVPVDPGEPSSPNFERKRAVYESRFRQFYDRVAAGRNAVNLDWLTEMYEHDTYDDFWKERSLLARSDDVQVPTLHGGVWYDHFIRGTLASHAAIDVPKRLFVGPGSLMTRLDLGDGGLMRMTIEWFDHFLRGVDNDVLSEAPARVYLLGAEEYVDLPTWPMPTTEAELFLSGARSGSATSVNDGSLVAVVPAGDSPDLLVHDPSAPNRTPRAVADQRPFEERALTFTSAPLESDVTIIGPSRLELYAACDASDVDLCVRLCDVAEDGRSRLLNTGALKASHGRSHEQPEALRAGEVDCYEIEIWAVANLFKAGHRIRVDVSTSDFPFFEANPVPSGTQFFHDADHPSKLVLPVVSAEAMP